MDRTGMVLAIIDDHVTELEQSAAGPCINALLGDVDRDQYREAVRRGSALIAVKILRERIRLALAAEPEQKLRRGKKA